MSLALALMLQAAALDWATLPELAYRNPPVVSASMVRFVAREVREGRCKPGEQAAATQALVVEVAVLVQPDGMTRSVVPRAMQCPVVEQYAAGLVTAFARNNLPPRGLQSEQWYRASVTFSLKP